MEQPKVADFVNILRQNSLTDREIVDVLCSIIQQQMMYGGSLEDKINCILSKYKV